MQRSRRKKLVNPSLQSKIILMFFFLTCISAMVQAVLVNGAMVRLSHVLDVESHILLKELPGILATSLGVTFLFMAPIMLGLGVLLTFRIAGPLYRFETYLRDLARGEDVGECSIREKDELHEMCEAINLAVGHLRESSSSPSQQMEPDRRLAS